MEKENELVALFMGGKKTNALGNEAWDLPDMAGFQWVLFYHNSWDWLMPSIRKINSMGKEYQFAIFKSYVSCTVEKNGKFYKDFSFSHAEYITSEQSDIQAAWKLVVRFIRWYNEIKVIKDLV